MQKKQDKKSRTTKSNKKDKLKEDNLDNVSKNVPFEEKKDDTPESTNQEVEEKVQNVKLFMIDFKECDPSKCSGRKLESFGLLKDINHKGRFRGVTLSANGRKVVSKEDIPIILEHGLCVIDCSWNKIADLKVKTHFDHERILPFMIAVNPINFGAPYKLSCAEALAASLFLCDFWDQGLALLEKFKWGPGFLTINKEVFEMYEECKNHEELIKAQEAYIELSLRQKEENRNKRMLPPSSSESEEGEEENESEDEKEKSESDNQIVQTSDETEKTNENEIINEKLEDAISTKSEQTVETK